MSLEQTLEQTNELLKQVITILQTGASAPAELGAPEVKAVPAMTAAVVTEPPKRGRPRKEIAAEAPAPETTYWLIEKHRTVYAQEPGMTAPSISGSEVVTKEVYEAKKSEFAALVNAPSPAPTAPTAPTAQVVDTSNQAAVPEPKPVQESSTTPSASADAAPSLTFEAVLQVVTAINKSPKPGHGRDGVMAILRKWLPDLDAPKVSHIAGRPELFAGVIADANALLNPPVDEYDPLA